jgi:hypothetical protein
LVSANLRSPFIGSDPGDKMNIKGVIYDESLKTKERSNGGGDINSYPK